MLDNDPPERQRVLLLISETRDHGSTAKIEDIVAAVGRSITVIDAGVFPVAVEYSRYGACRQSSRNASRA
jgi:hypothetical protein